MKKLYVLGMLLMTSSFQAFSATGHVLSAKITSLYCGYLSGHNMCSIEFDKTIEQRDSCNTIQANRMQFKLDNDIGQGLLGIALTAKASENLVNVYSTGACTVYGGLSDVNYIELLN